MRRIPETIFIDSFLDVASRRFLSSSPLYRIQLMMQVDFNRTACRCMSRTTYMQKGRVLCFSEFCSGESMGILSAGTVAS